MAWWAYDCMVWWVCYGHGGHTTLYGMVGIRLYGMVGIRLHGGQATVWHGHTNVWHDGQATVWHGRHTNV